MVSKANSKNVKAVARAAARKVAQRRKAKAPTGINTEPEIRRVQRSEIQLAAYNPRRMDPGNAAKLRKGLQEFGLVETLVWNKRTGNLVGGHQRLAVLDAEYGKQEYTVPVVCVDVDADRERVLNVALNNPTLQGEWDLDKLGKVLVEINTAHVDLELTGFDAAEIQTLTMDLRDDMDGGVPGGDQNGGGGGAPRKDVPQLLVVFEGPGQLAKVREAWGLKKGIKRVHLAECPVARSMFAKLWARASKKGRR